MFDASALLSVRADAANLMRFEGEVEKSKLSGQRQRSLLRRQHFRVKNSRQHFASKLRLHPEPILAGLRKRVRKGDDVLSVGWIGPQPFLLAFFHGRQSADR